VDLLINDAAIYLDEPFTEANEFDADMARRTFDVNAVGPLLMTKHFLALVLAGSGKKIVNISSEAGSISQNWRSREYAYCMSKAALNMQSVILQRRVKDDGVKVLAIQPGWMRTAMGGAGCGPRAERIGERHRRRDRAQLRHRRPDVPRLHRPGLGVVR
jgi:NAD(P)-dependent dehydrogenase (short-subunit alcohol dehydrogenase family)